MTGDPTPTRRATHVAVPVARWTDDGHPMVRVRTAHRDLILEVDEYRTIDPPPRIWEQSASQTARQLRKQRRIRHRRQTDPSATVAAQLATIEATIRRSEARMSDRGTAGRGKSRFRVVDQIHAFAGLVDGLLVEFHKFSSHVRAVQHETEVTA